MPSERGFYYEGFSSPNGTIVPDDVFDVLAPRLKESELRVLLYIVRRTFGFGKNADAISLRQMTNGITTRDGRIIDHGTGMSRKAVVKGVKGLAEKGIITIERRYSRKGDSDTNIYRLRFKSHEAVVTESNHPGYSKTPPAVTTGNPQDSVIQDSSLHNNITNKVVVTSQKEKNTETAHLYKDLRSIGIHHNTAAKLIREYTPQRITESLKFLIHKLQGGWQPQQSPAAWLVAALTQNYNLAYQLRDKPVNSELTDQRSKQLAKQQEDINRQFMRERRACLQRFDIEQDVDNLWQQVQQRLRNEDKWSPVLAATFLQLTDDGIARVLVPAVVASQVEACRKILIAAINQEFGKTMHIQVEAFE